MPGARVANLVPGVIDITRGRRLHARIDVLLGINTAQLRCKTNNGVHVHVGCHGVCKLSNCIGHAHGVELENLFTDGRDDHALVSGAIQVSVTIGIVGVPRAAQNQGLLAVEHLLASLDHLACALLVVDAFGNGHLDTADAIDHGNKIVKVDVGVVRDGHTRKFRNHFSRVGRPANRIGGINLLFAVPLEFHERVAVNRYQGHLFIFGIHTHKHNRVRAVRVRILAVLLAVDAILVLIDTK